MSTLRSFFKKYGLLGPAITALGGAVAGVAAGVWAAATYLHTAKLDYAKDFNTKQVSALFLAAETAAGLVAEIDEAAWNAQRTVFWKLHWGDLIVFENPEIECAATYLGAKLNITAFGSRNTLGPEVFALSNAVRKFITYKVENDWRIDLPDLVGAKAASVAPLLGVKLTSEARDAYRATFQRIAGKCRTILVPPSQPAPPETPPAGPVLP